jgi:hypothetical protein
MKKIAMLFFAIWGLYAHTMECAEKLISTKELQEAKKIIIHELVQQLGNKNTPILVFSGGKAVLSDFKHGHTLYIPQYTCKDYTSGFAVQKNDQTIIIGQDFRGTTAKLLELNDARATILNTLLYYGAFAGLCTQERVPGGKFEWCSDTQKHTTGKYQIYLTLSDGGDAQLIRNALYKRLPDKKRRTGRSDPILPARSKL